MNWHGKFERFMTTAQFVLNFRHFQILSKGWQ